MLVASMSSGKPRMALLVMQHHYLSASQDFPTQLASWAPGDQHVTVDRFAMSIDVENRLVFLLFLLVLGSLVMPQGPCPLCQRISQPLVCSGMCQPGEKLLHIGIAVGTAASGHQGQQGSRVGAQIPGASQPSHGQKEQCQDQSFDHRQGARQAIGASRTGDALNRGPKLSKKPRLVGCRQQQEAANPLLPDFLGLR